MKSEYVYRVAPPLYRHTVSAYRKPGKFVDSPCGRVITGQPLWVEKHEGIAASHRNTFPNYENVAIDIGRVHSQPDRSGIRYVSRRSNSGWRRRRFGPSTLLSETLAVTQNESAVEEPKEI